MSDVLIIAVETAAIRRLREALELDGNTMASASSLIAALPALYLSPCALRVIVGGDAGGYAAEDTLRLAAADPGPLGRHSYAFLGVETLEGATQSSGGRG